MRYRKQKLALILAVALMAACTNKVKTQPGVAPQPVLDSIAVHLNEVANGAKAVRKVKESLLADGRISKETSHTITLALIKIDRVGQEMNAKLKGYESFTPTAKADLLKLFNDLEAGYRDLTANGTFKANAEVEKLLPILDAALSALRVFFK